MERLTKLGRVMGEEKVCCTHFDCKECNDLSGQCSDGCSWEEKAWEKLFDYEETGLTPQDCANFKAFMNEAISRGITFNRIVELMEAEEHGRLFVSPVKVGDMLWVVYWDEVLGAWGVDDVPERVNEVGSEGFFLAACLGDPEAPDEFHPYEEIGKEFFLTQEKAVEAAAAKGKEVQGDG